MGMQLSLTPILTRLVCLLLLCFPAHGADAGPAAEHPPDGAEAQLFDYNNLTQQLGDIVANRNQLRAKRELEQISAEGGGKLFLISADVGIKSERIINKKSNILWINTPLELDVEVRFAEEHEEIFMGISEWDYVSIVAKLTEIKIKSTTTVTFEFVHLRAVEPFNLRLEPDQIINYNLLLDEIEAIKNDGSRFDLRDRIDLISQQHRNKLGYLVGKVKSVKDVNNKLVLTLDIKNETVEVQFLNRYRDQLELIEAGNHVRVAVRCQTLSMTDPPKFFRGCFYNP